jgi:Cu(I)/Ag(I) efflux system protein CusF
MKRLVAVLAVVALGIGGVPMAAAQMKHDDMKGMEKGGQTHKGTGVVTGIDRNAGKVTLKHDPIKSLNWPGMTMAFAVKDKAMLDKLAKDKKVEFELEQQGQQFVITSIK